MKRRIFAAVVGIVLSAVFGAWLSCTIPDRDFSRVYQPEDIDTDSDGLPDSWEMEYFGDLSENGGGDPDGDGISNLDEWQSGTDPTVSEGNPPAFPTNVRVTPGQGQNTIAWDPVIGATSYRLYWTDDGSTPTTSSTNRITGITAVTYAHTGLNNGTAYTYIVTAVGPTGESGGSVVRVGIPQIPMAPAAPTNVQVTPGDEENTVSWSPVATATGYNIYWEVAPSTPSSASTNRIPGATSPHAHTGLSNGIEYWYVVTAENAVGESPESAVATGIPAIPVPIGILVQAGTEQNLISWSPVSGVDGYNIYWSTNGSDPTKATGTKIAGGTSPYLHAGLIYGTEYRYTVVSVRGGQKSAESTVACGTPTPPVGTQRNFCGIEFVWIPAGTFQMGSPTDETNRWPDESPLHLVEISRGFWMSKYEITQAQYSNFVGVNPSYFNGPNRPVEQVGWVETPAFCTNLAATLGKPVRLPTEAEWEYACRAGTTTPYNTGITLSTDQANYNSSGTVDVGSYPANAWGLCDMHGNVWEFCLDWYASGYYQASPTTDPAGPPTGSTRVMRGGAYNRTAAFYCRSAHRYQTSPGIGSRYRSIGFRVVCTEP
jgi:formylglycine-generating enzyme required for sulfatase activity